MMLTILSLINYELIMVFGFLLSVYFAGIEITRKNQWSIFCALVIMIPVQFISWQCLGYETTRKIYPLIIHLPIILFIILYFKRSLSIAFVSVLCAYLCCQTPQWFASLAQYLFDSKVAYYIVNSLIVFPALYLLKKYVVSSVHHLMSISLRSRLLFGIVPLMYYIFDYATTVYTKSLYHGIEVAVIFMPSVVSAFYFIFIIYYYNEMLLRYNAEKEHMLLSVQIKQAEIELSAFQESQKKNAIYRHDMRHHLNLIGGLLADGDTQKAMEYITRTQSGIQAITPTRYCENITINLILSIFASKAKTNNIAYSVNVQIPQNISIAETELCALLSNGLENAINACTKITDERPRYVQINCRLHKGNLLISIENSFSEKIVTEIDLPKNNDSDHGFGIRSMKMIVEKYNGYYDYTAKDGIFTLKMVIPSYKSNSRSNK